MSINLYWDYLPHSREEEGLRYRDWWISGAHDRLSDLAWWMRQSGGPVGTMDATIASLYELRAWAAPYLAAGMPGVPPVDAFPDYRAWRSSSPRHWALHGAIDEYVLRALRGLDPEVAWGMEGGPVRRIPNDTFHTTLYMGSGGRSATPFARLFVHQGKPGDRPVFDEPRIRELIDQQLGLWGDPATPQHRGPSILEPLLAGPPRALGERPIPPDFVRPHVAPEKLARQVVVSPAARSLSLDLLPALDPQHVAHTLNYTGFRVAGLVRADELVDGARFFHNEGASVVTMVAHAGAVRGFLLEQPLLPELFERAGLQTWPAPTAWAERGLYPRVTPLTPSTPRSDFPRPRLLTVASPRKPGGRVPSARHANELDVDAARALTRGALLAFPPRLSEKGDGTITPRPDDGVLRHAVTAHRIDFDMSELPPLRAAWLFAQAAEWADARGAVLYADGLPILAPRPAPLAHIPLTVETTPYNYGLAIHIVSWAARSLDPAELPPIDAGHLSAALSAFGFRCQGRPVRPKDLVNAARLTASLTETVPPRYSAPGAVQLSAVVGAVDGAVRVVTLKHDYGTHWMFKHSPQAMPGLAELLRGAQAKLAVGPALPSSKSELAALSSWAQLMGPVPEMPPGEYVIGREPVWRDPAALEPLPVPELVATLTALGAVLPDGGPVTGVFDDTVELDILDGTVQVYVTSHEGRPRLVQTDTHSCTPEEWRPVQRALEAYAHVAGASFISVEEAWEDAPSD